MGEGIHIRAKSEIVENSLKEAYFRIPKGIWFVFSILQRTTFCVEAYLDMDKHEGQSRFKLV